MLISEAEKIIKDTYERRDRSRGVPLTFLHFVEEVGELARSLRSKNKDDIGRELADVFAWLLSVSYLLEIDLEGEFVRYYGKGCPKCGSTPCKCPPLEG
ncbi:MAG: nucleotide pyrophosphohydrolase [Thermoproteota archaeon]|nr:MAG: nucleotide pyrophosphohydrolase [Candidatus Korarchaeota archaeon]